MILKLNVVVLNEMNKEMQKVEFMSRVSLFSQMREKDIEFIARKANQLTFQGGDVIISEGDQDHRLFIVQKGFVQVVKDRLGPNEKILGLFGPYSYFGEMALIDEMARSASVVALKEAHVLCLEQLDLRKELERTPAMALELLRMLSQRIRANEKFIFKTLGTVLPICANCKDIRDDDGSWTSIENYIRDHAGTEFSHSVCPKCAKELYPDYNLYNGSTLAPKR